MTVSFNQLKNELERVLVQLSFPKSKASLCASIFAGNSRDGVYSHGINRFPVFVNLEKERLVDPGAEQERITTTGNLESWDGHHRPGMYNATVGMDRVIQLAQANGSR